MNENHEEQRQRTDRESEGPRILSIRELEPEEKAPPGPPTREYPPERIRRPGIPPRIVEEPRRESGKRKILLILLVAMLIICNVALIGLCRKQAKQIEEMRADIDSIDKEVNLLLSEQTEKILDEVLSRISVNSSEKDLKVGEPIVLKVEGLTNDLFSEFQLKPEEIQIDVVILKEGGETEIVKGITLGTSEITVAPGELFGVGSYIVKVRIVYKGVEKEKTFDVVKIHLT